MKRMPRRKAGQAMTEYIIIVVIVALAALAIVAVFSDTLRSKFGGAVREMGGDASAVDDALGTGSLEQFREMDESGFRN